MNGRQEARRIRNQAGGRSIRDVLQSLFVAEFLSPGPELWVVSPRIDDVPVVDNRADTFQGLLPDVGPAPITLSEALVLLARRGATIKVLFDERPENMAFGRSILERRVAKEPVACRRLTGLGDSGLLGRRFVLQGAIGLTHQALDAGGVAELHLDEGPIASARLAFLSAWERAK